MKKLLSLILALAVITGEYVQSVGLHSAPEEDCPIILKIMAYEPETYYSAGAISLSTQMLKWTETRPCSSREP